jgi:GPH family glycoside/pentoside/hexuronide:cation symporter
MMRRVTAQPRSPVPLRTKLLYGAGDVGVALSATAIGTYLLFFYTDVAGLGIGLAGLVKGIGRIWDAVTDPPMGYLSDRTQSRFGRRRIWFGIAAVPLGLSVYALFAPPEGLGEWALFGWMLVAYLAAYLFFTMFLTPYYALGAELSDDPDERTQIVAIRTLFQYVGSVVGGFMPFFAVSLGDPRTGYGLVAAAFGLLAGSAILLAFFGTSEAEAPPRRSASFGDFLRGTRLSLTNRPFRILLLTFVVMSVGGGVNGAVAVYALIYWLGFTQREVGIIIPVYLGAAALALPFWVMYSARVGKDRALKQLCIYEVFVLSAIYFLIPWKPLVYLFLIFAGFGLAGFVVTASLLADVLDHDELTTGEQRGGAFFGFWTFATKFTSGFGPPLVGGALALVGYVPNQPQSELVIQTMRWLYGPISGLFFLAAAVIFWRFPLTREAHREIQEEVYRRRTAAAAPPISHVPLEPPVRRAGG